MARIQDVAAAAGVSKTTVSYVFSPQKSQLISADTREKVLAAALRLGYRPSFFGKALSQKRSFNIALLLPSRSAQTMSATLLRIFHGIVHCAESSDYNVSVFFGAGKRFFNRSREGRFDGVIVIGLGADTAALDRVAALNLPLVVINRKYPADEKISCIHSDIAGWFSQEVDRMLQAGCRELLVLNKGLHADAGKRLDEVFDEVQARAKAQNGAIEYAVISKNLSLQVNELLQKKHYDGIILNSSEGSEVVNALTLHKLLPGRDIQLSGFVRNPSLRTAGLDWENDALNMGIQGWAMLMRLLNGGSGEYTLLPVTRKTERVFTKVEYADGFDI